jgi:hypothetical protein
MTPARYRAKGDGSDDSIALQRWLDGIAGKSGTLDRWYYSSRSLRVHPDTTVYGSGRLVSGIAAHASMSVGATLWGNSQFAHETTDRQGGIRFIDCGFRGTPAHREAGAMVVLVGTRDTAFIGCGFSNWRHLVTPANTRGLTFDSCEFSDWGGSEKVPKPGACEFDGGYALLGGSSYANNDVDVIGCNFHDGLWTAIDNQHGCLRWRIIDTKIARVHECGIYLGADHTIIDRCSIIDVRLRDCSAHCIEGGGIGQRITRSTFGRPDSVFFMMTNPVDLEFTDNTCFDAQEQYPPNHPADVWSSAIMARNIPADAAHRADGLTVADNIIMNAKGKASSLLYMYDQGGGPFHNVSIGPNRQPAWRGGMLCCEPSAKGRNFNVTEEHA